MRAAVLSMIVLASTPAWAESSYQVNPTTISLSKAEPTDAVVISNHGTGPLRVQLQVMTWTEDRDGQMQLAATSDIVVRPSLVQVEPGQSKTVRVGNTLGAQTTEQTYRLFVEELPDRSTPEGGRVQVLTRVGVPVFVTPTSSRVALAATVDVAANQAIVEVTHTGTAHAKIASVIVRADQRWERRAVGWYVLPGKQRRFGVDLGDDTCRPGETLTATLVADDGTTWTSAPQRCE